MWLDLLKAAILGIVEGATEFIPVSSTGHLILVADWLNFGGPRAATFEIFIQLAAILAVVYLYRARVFAVLRDLPYDPGARKFVFNLIVAFVPAAGIGFFIHDWIKEVLFSTTVVAWALVLGGFVILLIEKWNPPEQVTDTDHIPVRVALGVGLAQVLSLVPGVSRSGATIMGGRSLGMSRQAATEFSFFLAIPIMVMASAYDLFKSRDVLSAADLPVFAVGFVVSFLSALVVIRAFLAFVARRTFVPFAWYRIGFGCLLLLWYLVLG